jgi:hypothetical protein
MKPGETPCGEGIPRGLETLAQCLRQYVETNPSRFAFRENRSDRRRILTIIPAQVTDQS